jgi:GrpB-like predicted nucleotidyltransferase (UPF0157 family)
LLGVYPSHLSQECQAVTVVPHRREWSALAAAEIDRLRGALDERAFGLEHVGSTAVPGLPAKPIVDLALGIAADEADPFVMRTLRRLGYVARRRDATQRLHYRRGSPRAFTLHVVRFEGPDWNAYLALRDLLRAQPEVAARYSSLKLRLAREGADPATYAAAKAELLESLGASTRRPT